MRALQLCAWLCRYWNVGFSVLFGRSSAERVARRSKFKRGRTHSCLLCDRNSLCEDYKKKKITRQKFLNKEGFNCGHHASSFKKGINKNSWSRDVMWFFVCDTTLICDGLIDEGWSYKSDYCEWMNCIVFVWFVEIVKSSRDYSSKLFVYVLLIINNKII